ncbi:MAG: BamA/TamA family outer membrane protein, partial [Rhodothermales bacterium]|nr:BamA/TamA family outer membrane protein [Rhodothermales bacterium]
VIRLTRFYNRNGFPAADIDYPASQFDAGENTIHIIFSVREGPPLRLSELDASLSSPIVPGLQKGWDSAIEDVRGAVGQRFTDFERLNIENRLQSYLQNGGYAFSHLESTVDADSAQFQASLMLDVRPGPLARVDEIQVDGNQRVSDRTVQREVPIDVGDVFNRRKMIRGQEQIFGLNLFRLALVDLPEQPEDSTVTIRYRVRETESRYVTAQTGFSRERGVSLEGGFRHRNFLGGARQLSANASGESGLFASPTIGREPVRSFNSGISLRQPYILTTRLSGSIAPFYNWLDDPNQDTKFYEGGVSLSGLFELLPFRNLSGQYRFSRAVPLTESGLGGRLDVYDRSILSADLSFGNLDDFLNPRRGYMVRPHIESGGLVGPSGVEYLKTRLDVTGYLPLTRSVSLAASVSAGRIWLKGASVAQTDPQIEFRFDNIRFYAGGSGDVRGWGLNTLGPQAAVADSIVANDDGTFDVRGARFESIGGEAKAVARVELRVPFPGLSEKWGLAGFLDAGAVSAELNRDEEGRIIFTDDGIASFSDGGTIRTDDFRFGTGVGMRYRTPVGLIRLDLAYKLNPSPTDLRSATEMVRYEQGLTDSFPKGSGIRRLNLHLTIDRSF